MKKKIAKLVSLLLIVSMILAMAPEAYAASVIPVKVSASYKKSKYYTAANTAYNTYRNASDAERFVRVALSQKGYKGSNKNKDYDGIGSKTGAYTEYSRWMGVNGKDWCASFVSWSAAAAGISKKVIVPGGGCGHWRKKSPNGGTFHKLWSSDFKTYYNYKPQVGDIALYTPLCSKCGRHYNSLSPTSHVVIVTDVADTQNRDGSWTFTTIERSGNVVGSNTLTTKSTRGSKGTCTCKKLKSTGMKAYTVQGFFHPNWADGRTAPNHLSSGTGSVQTKVTPTPTQAPVQTQTPAQTNKNVQILHYTSAPTELTSNNAVLKTKVIKPAGTKVEYVGLLMYNLTNMTRFCNMHFMLPDVSGWSDFVLTINIQDKVKKALAPNTSYSYQFYTEVNGVCYSTNVKYFTTSKSQSSQATTVVPTATPTPRPTATPTPSPTATPTPKPTAAPKPEDPVKVTYPTDPKYLAKFSVTRNNAVLVAHITKPKGSKVNYVGMVMYCNGKVVCDKTFKVTNVPNSYTSFHAWFNVKKEMGVTLKSKTTYTYRIYTKVDGVKYVSAYRNFTTK